MILIKDILFLILLASLLSCDSSAQDNTATIKDDKFLIPVSKNQDTLKFIWQYDYEKQIPVRLNTVDPDSLNPEKLIDIINTYRGQNKIILDLLKISNDTIYVVINESTYLSQNIGTTGVDDYISTTVFTLTELKGVKYVNLDFAEGDHAQSGTFSRQFYINRSNTTTIDK